MSSITTMKSKYVPIKPRKIPYYLSLITLTLGASLILGFLSFGGMYILLPILPLAFATFALSVAYEGEIYLQNIKGAFNKLFKENYLKNHLAKEFLLSHFPKNTDDEHCPQFFKDYKAQLNLLKEFGHKELNEKSKKRKKEIEKTLGDMEKWFALQLFPSRENRTDESDYAKNLDQWLAKNQQEEWQKLLKKRTKQFLNVASFSTLAGIFMGLGSTYLIVELFSLIPLFVAIPFTFWPIFILPMSLVAGVAYAMQTYNAVTDIINNNTVLKWYDKIRQDLSKGITVRSVFMATTAVVLVGLAIALTICTAGTWWTIATSARPLFDWMRRMPSFIMGVINPAITGLSAIFFNIQNSAESLEMVDQVISSKKNVFQRIYESVINGWSHLRQTENWWQIFNPFRLILKLTITPLRVVLFLGHLISIALTSDRMPGVPQIVSVLVGIICEGFEDAHYFVGGSDDQDNENHHTMESHHETMIDNQDHNEFQSLLKDRLSPAEDHEHSVDIPTWILRTIASPVYALAALWDSSFSQLNHSGPVNTAGHLSSEQIT